MKLEDFINELKTLGEGWDVGYEDFNLGNGGVSCDMVFTRGKKLGSMTFTDFVSDGGYYDWKVDVYEEKAEYSMYQNKWTRYVGVIGELPEDEEDDYYCISVKSTAYYKMVES